MAYCIDRAIYRANKAKTIVARDSPLDMIVEGALAPPASYVRGGDGERPRRGSATLSVRPPKAPPAGVHGSAQERLLGREDYRL